MLHIILMLLKIIGIVLAVLLGLILLVLCLVLFVPICYQGTVDKNGAFYAEGNVTWLFRLLHISAEYREKKFRVNVRILWFRIFDTAEDDNAQDPDSNDFFEDDLFKEDFGEKRSTPTVKTSSAQKAIPEKSTSEETAAKDIDAEENNAEENNAEENNADRSSFEELPGKMLFREKLQRRYNGLKHKILTSLQKLKKKLQNLKKTMDDLKSKLDYYKRLWYDIHTQEAIRHLKKEIFYLLRHFLPKKVTGDVLFGLEDTAQTGEILGILSVLQGFSGNDKLFIEADFEKKCFEGNALLKGHIRLCHLLKARLALLLDKHCRVTFSRIRRLRSG